MNRNNWGDNFTTIIVVAGGERINLPPNSPVYIAQRPNGLVYFNSLLGKYFQLLDYDWQGPIYNTVVTTQEIGTVTHKNKGKSKEKTKRNGGLLGAAVGTAVAGPVGLAVGYAATSKKVTKGKVKNKGREVINNRSVMNQNQIEVDSIAKIELGDIETRQSFSIGIRCNSQIDIELDGFMWPDATIAGPQQSAPALSEVEKIAILKEYKGLLDAGVISQVEFENKKRELLGGNQLINTR